MQVMNNKGADQTAQGGLRLCCLFSLDIAYLNRQHSFNIYGFSADKLAWFYIGSEKLF